ncbi:L-seryl-tRNA(Sec) selenium transferase [Xenorhabdus sp. 42]|uniref:L-seryl-tRNA(Sec) selenium transferase n=1 Tax=Xenorhabdus szentirmaii TaxID=290112 RepID=UPI00198EB0EF|nr:MULTISPECIES: L-seryl-tRNA(Sec) selenium transferase [unclassified Xenorhabdus]MBD2780616.1 L-seryl-tRNA(Sec) selenium transferase [Xenorhabdus sp. 38]MBD2792841.1 L-seryl-tRNA(Sec) selenium transferase [Xenorhabdus sp. CUL]MBD2803205.1 L-seryl-tRNA(Sec) selenium transferase [Xenorhabdus sp. ZM]MBD2820288.1 L-seryl-tRNA(Sec) selenium transferase [Xenorhabdus sp. 42]MBD2824428.1 L-seryl-tRNA(Sec) selenium transferase [Xenorhabdus sp. 5]
MTQTINSLYRQLPSIDKLLREPEIIPLVEVHGQTRVVNMLREMQEQARFNIQQYHSLPEWSDNWVASLHQRVRQDQASALKPVFNLSGTVLHTNLGRALLAESAIDAVTQVMRSPVTLEYSLDGASRGHRDRALADLLCELTGAEDACIVNNNAAAVLLVLAAVAQGKQVIVSRGELVEIGGAFRIPDVMVQAGCRLVEVGTTNRTHLKDYQQAINPETGLLMKVHASNYSIEGFTADVSGESLAQLGKVSQIPTAIDLGSGSMIDMTKYGLPAEPMPKDYLSQGIDLVTFSGDKLLGGPQAGIIVGKKPWIEAIQRHPLKRALRADKMTLAALEATLRLYQYPEQLPQKLPTLRLLTRAQNEIYDMAQQLLPRIQAYYSEKFLVRDEPCHSQIGSGSLPVDRLPSWALTFTAIDGRGSTLEKLACQWRNLNKPVIGRLYDGRLWLDLRCLEDENALLQALSL